MIIPAPGTERTICISRSGSDNPEIRKAGNECRTDGEGRIYFADERKDQAIPLGAEAETLKESYEIWQGLCKDLPLEENCL
jgi:hypothetical protein